MSALLGDRYVPDPAERAAWAVFELDLNTRMPKGTPTKRVTRPWAGKKPIYKAVESAEITPARAARRAKLDALF